jgi:hypothetical protein
MTLSAAQVAVMNEVLAEPLPWHTGTPRTRLMGIGLSLQAGGLASLASLLSRSACVTTLGAYRSRTARC